MSDQILTAWLEQPTTMDDLVNRVREDELGKTIREIAGKQHSAAAGLWLTSRQIDTLITLARREALRDVVEAVRAVSHDAHCNSPFGPRFKCTCPVDDALAAIESLGGER